MKVFFSILCMAVAVHAVSDKLKAEIARRIAVVGGKCAEEAKATKDDIATMMAKQIPESRTGKCTLYCIYREFKSLNEDGSYNREGALKFIEQFKEDDPEFYNILMAGLEHCDSSMVFTSDPCDNAKIMADCFYKEGKDAGIEDYM